MHGSFPNSPNFRGKKSYTFSNNNVVVGSGNFSFASYVFYESVVCARNVRLPKPMLRFLVCSLVLRNYCAVVCFRVYCRDLARILFKINESNADINV